MTACSRHRSTFLVIAAALVIALFAEATRAAPNIVLIMADDMGYECVGANGGTSYKTPHLDRLAKTGLRFEHCHSQPLCTPSRVQIMTGLYNDRSYIRFGLLDPKATTFAHMLKKAGYATCVAGKWQLEGGLDAPSHFGFDEYCLWQLTRRPSRYPNPGLEINGELVDYTSGEYGPDVVCDYLCDFITRHKDGPFFAYYPMILPHWPFEPTPDSADWDPQAKGATKGQGKNRYFADMVAYTDKMVGKIVARLEELDLRDDTLVLFTCDNGTAVGIESRMGEKVVPGGKGKTTDNGTHVPLIANWPGVVPAGVSHDLVDFTDVLPTLAEISGAPLPAGVELDGRSFAPQLRGEPGRPRTWIFSWYERNGRRNQASRWARDQHFKLYDNGRFFDVVADPKEETPLDPASLSDAQRKVREEFQAVLDAREKYK
ncbi:MAG: sulfatase-like hydrolase/transferase [Planctomycetes bacterium]|nr:sulfatase-like hydrolase/transferase [Planctomycetota bacterium]